MTPKTEATQSQVPSGGRAAAWVAAGILASRMAGLVREAVFAFFFGSTPFADAWRAALRIPNVLQNLLGEGTLSASFIPIYAELLEREEHEAAGRFAGAAFGILTATAGALALAGVVLAPVVVTLFAPGFDGDVRDLTITLVRILFPMTGVLVLSAWALGVLNSHRRFFVSYVAPVVWNLAIIVTMVTLGWIWAFDQDDLIVALGWGALVGGVLQLGVQIPFLRGLLEHFRPSISLEVPGIREAIRNFVPVVSARGIVNLSALAELILATLLFAGAVAILGYAQILYVLPISLFGLSVAAAELPELSRQRSEDARVLANRVSEALERVAYFVVPSALAYLFFGDVVVAALFQRGEFGLQQTLGTYAVLAAYSIGLLASASSRLLSSAFYALRDTRTPARIAYLRVAISLACGAALMFPLDRIAFGDVRLGAAGLAGGASIAAWIEYVLLRGKLRGALGPHGPAHGRVLRILVAAALGAAAGHWGAALVPGRHPVTVAAGTLLPFGVVYLAATGLLGVGVSLRGLIASRQKGASRSA